jgi:hypothetical protein
MNSGTTIIGAGNILWAAFIWPDFLRSLAADKHIKVSGDYVKDNEWPRLYNEPWFITEFAGR